MGMKQDDWQQNKENAAKGVFPENFTQRLWTKEVLCLSLFLQPHCIPPFPALISTRTLAIEARLIPPRQKPRVPQVWKQTSAALTKCRFSHFIGAALHCCDFFTSGNDLRFPVMPERCRDGCLCNAYCCIKVWISGLSLTAILCIHMTVADWHLHNP